MSEDIDSTRTATWADDELVPGMTVVPDEAAGARPPAGHVDQFDVALRGYDRHQVDDYLAQLGAYVAQLRTDLGAAQQRADESAREADRLNADLERGRPSFDALGQRVTQMLGLAEAEADQLRSQARTETDELREAAGREAAQIRSDARREADELAASTRLELADLGRQREQLLEDLAAVRSVLDEVLRRSPRRIDLSAQESSDRDSSERT